VSFGTATTSDGSVVAWVARRPGGTRVLKAAWIPWNSSVAGEAMTLAEDVADLPPQPIARDDGSVWVIYADGHATAPSPAFWRSCIDCSILARTISAAGPVGDTPVTLAAVDGLLDEFQASARLDGGLLLWWHHQGDDAPIQSSRAFDSRGIPLAVESELPGRLTDSQLAVADKGGALLVARFEESEQGQPFDELFGLHYDSRGAILWLVGLTPPIQPPGATLYEFDVSRAAGGGYWLTWRESREGVVKLRARRLAAGGDPGPTIVAGTDPTATPVAPTPDGGFLVCWESHGKLLAQLHGKHARPLGGPIQLARGAKASGQLPLQLAVTATGRGVVAWWGPPATDHSRALFLTRFTVTSRPTRGR
jgi:hypothetical protein